MISVLVNAYACSPNMGSEPGMAWNWCVNLAKYCELHIITEGEFKDKIEVELSTLPQRYNMHFYYNPVSDKIRKMCWNQGDWRFYYHYKKWQYKTYQIAQGIIETTHIDIIHQLNMIGFREPGYLWKIKNIPFIWGPIDAKEGFPTAYLQGASIKTKIFIYLKIFLTSLQLRYSKRVNAAARNATVIIAASTNSQLSIKKYFGIDSPLINETGCYTMPDISPITKAPTKMLDLLWVGKSDFRKQLGIAIRAIAATKNKRIKLHIVGDIDSTKYEQLSLKLNVNEQCIWHGRVSHQTVQEIMQNSDLLFFTSIAEGTPHVVLESISNNLPVICFNTCGQGDSITKDIGLKINLTNPHESIKEFANHLNYLFQNRDLITIMSKNCINRKEELSWNNKAKQVLELYNKALHK